MGISRLILYHVYSYLLATIDICLGIFQVYVGLIQTPQDEQIDFFFSNSGGTAQAKNFIYLFNVRIASLFLLAKTAVRTNVIDVDIRWCCCVEMLCHLELR